MRCLRRWGWSEQEQNTKHQSMILFYMETVDNLKLIRNNFIHIKFELARKTSLFFRIAKEAHHACYRAMIEALKSSNNFFVTNQNNKLYRYQRGDDPWMEIRKTSVPGCKFAWRYSKPVQCIKPTMQSKSSKKSQTKDFLISFWDALAMIQAECFMLQFVQSKCINVTDDEMKILEWLHREIRNEFEHFIPKFYGAPISDLRNATNICIRFTKELLFNSGNVLWVSSPKKLESLIDNVSNKLASSPKP